MVKAKRNLYGNPFKKSAEQLRHVRRQRLELLAHFVKKSTGSKKSIKWIAADLSLAEMNRKKKVKKKKS